MLPYRQIKMRNNGLFWGLVTPSQLLSLVWTRQKTLLQWLFSRNSLLSEGYVSVWVAWVSNILASWWSNRGYYCVKRKGRILSTVALSTVQYVLYGLVGNLYSQCLFVSGCCYGMTQVLCNITFLNSVLMNANSCEECTCIRSNQDMLN